MESLATRDVSLSTHGLTCGYAQGFKVTGVEISVGAGEVCCLIGANGAGKSTILTTLAADLVPLAGKVVLCGRDASTLSPGELALLRATLLTERPRTELLRVRDIVSLGRQPHTGAFGRLAARDLECVDEALELAGVADLADTDFSRLSDGQRQRVMLARAIAQQTPVLMLDEPCNYLDIRYRIELVRILRALAARRRCAIVATLHDIALAPHLADWLVCVAGGTVMCQGRPQDVLVPEVIDPLFGLEPGTFDARSGTYTMGRNEVRP